MCKFRVTTDCFFGWYLIEKWNPVWNFVWKFFLSDSIEYNNTHTIEEKFSEVFKKIVKLNINNIFDEISFLFSEVVINPLGEVRCGYLLPVGF